MNLAQNSQTIDRSISSTFTNSDNAVDMFAETVFFSRKLSLAYWRACVCVSLSSEQEDKVTSLTRSDEQSPPYTNTQRHTYTDARDKILTQLGNYSRFFTSSIKAREILEALIPKACPGSSLTLVKLLHKYASLWHYKSPIQLSQTQRGKLQQSTKCDPEVKLQELERDLLLWQSCWQKLARCQLAKTLSSK